MKGIHSAILDKEPVFKYHEKTLKVSLSLPRRNHKENED